MNARQGQGERDPVEALATQFVERLRLGEHPSVEEYAAGHPELAAEINDLFPTIAAMEQLKSPSEQPSSGHASLGATTPERLGDFRILRQVGRGGMGVVFEAEQESLGRRVAVKVLPKTALLEPKHLQRFQREAQTAAGLHHTNIVPVLGVGQQDGFHYYVMQFIEGAGLDQVLAHLACHSASDEDQPLSSVARQLLAAERDVSSASTALDDALRPTKTAFGQATQLAPRDADDVPPTVVQEAVPGDASYWRRVARLGVQVADAVQYAHDQGILHRDIKPANLIIDTQGVVWVADFGLAKALDADRVSLTGDVVGTPAYMAPEQIGGRADHRSDIYSLGLTLYELLTLQPAFQEADRARLLKRIATSSPPRLRQLRPEVPADLETIVLKATAHEPERRYQSAAELADDLRCYLEDRPIQARRVGGGERLWRWCRRNPVVAGLTATAATLLVLVAATASIGYTRTNAALSGERTERQRAEAATGLAIEVLDRIYERFAFEHPDATDEWLGDDPGAAKPVLSEGTAAVLEDMLVFYDRLAEQSGGDGAYLEKIALANRRVGNIRHHLGQLAKAKAAYERALALYGQLDETAENAHFIETATILVELGVIAERTGQHDQATASWNKALRTFQQATDAGIETEQLRRDMARARAHLAGDGGARRHPPMGPHTEGRPPRGSPVDPFRPPPPRLPGLHPEGPGRTLLP